MNILLLDPSSFFLSRVVDAIAMVFDCNRELLRLIKVDSIDAMLELCEQNEGPAEHKDDVSQLAVNYDYTKIDLFFVAKIDGIDFPFPCSFTDLKCSDSNSVVIYLIDGDIDSEIADHLTKAGVTTTLCRPTVDDIKKVLSEFYQQHATSH
ncbi:MAG: hypothetical protein WC575_01005 [Patescibacteria group bacterium]